VSRECQRLSAGKRKILPKGILNVFRQVCSEKNTD